MLDDLKVIHERDVQDALGVVQKQSAQLQHAFGFSWQPPREIYDVVIAGMGGSALAAKVFQSWPGVDVPVTIVQDYELPNHVNEHTLLICSSYSGNTEEVLSVFDAATHEMKDGAEKPMTIAMSSGGALIERAKSAGVPMVELPAGIQPRFTLGFQLRALVEIFEQTPLLAGASSHLEEVATILPERLASYAPTVPTDKNPAKQLAQELMGKSVVIYAGPKLAPAAYKWKINFNENAKHLAWWNQFSEFNHNEILGWTEQPTEKPYAVIELRSELEHERIQKRFTVTERLLSGKRPAPEVIEVTGATLCEQLLWAIALGDFVSIYLAILNNVNPTPVALLEKFKQDMHED